MFLFRFEKNNICMNTFINSNGNSAKTVLISWSNVTNLRATFMMDSRRNNEKKILLCISVCLVISHNIIQYRGYINIFNIMFEYFLISYMNNFRVEIVWQITRFERLYLKWNNSNVVYRYNFIGNYIMYPKTYG